MEIQDYIHAKQTIETEISNILNEFVKETGLSIDDVGIIKHKLVGVPDRYSVKVQVTL